MKILGLFGILAIFLAAAPHVASSEPDYQLAEGDTLPRVLKLIQKNYVAPDIIDPSAMLQAAFDNIQRTIPEILAVQNGKTFTLTIDQATRSFPLRNINTLTDLWRQLRELFFFVDLHYHGETPLKDIEYLAVEGILKTLDPHSALFRPKEYREFQVGTKGNFGGIGIVIGTRDGHLTIIAPIDGTPAAHAGLKAQDKIVQIGEDSTVNMSLNDAVERLRGRVGTSVVLTVERVSRPQFNVTLKRAIIQIDSVQSAALVSNDKTIGYLKVKSFQENTMNDFLEQLGAMRKKAGDKFGGLILDLRNDPGGLLQQAIEMVDTFIDDGIIVSTVGANNKSLEQIGAAKSTTLPKFPVVVLINEGSASASEIVSGSLQAHNRALVVGTRSFGKGSVQTVYNLRDGSALKLTIAEYLTAGKNSIQEVGVTPDILLRPITISKDNMNLIPDKLYSESDLEMHLKRTAQELSESKYNVRYLTAVEDENNPDNYSTKLDLKNDFTVQFASDLLAKTDLKEINEVIKDAQNIEEKKIVAELEKLGISWKREQEKDRPTLQLTYKLIQKGKVVKSVLAGESAELLLNCKNISKSSFYRLIGQTSSDAGLFNNKEFAFGKIGPGEERSWSVKFETGKHMLSESVPVDVEFFEANNFAPKSLKLFVPIDGRPRPQFAYHYILGSPVKTKVKIDKALPIGKSIPLQINVRNIGPGTSEETIVSIKNVDTKGPFIEIGRTKLGKIKPGESSSATLRFHVDPEFKSSSFKMELAIIDTELLESVSDQLEFTMESGNIDPAAGPWYQGPIIDLAKDIPLTTNESLQMLDGFVTDDQMVKDVFIFLDNKKVFYQATADRQAKVKIRTQLDLKEGNNVITIAARDNNDLVSRQTITIYRNSAATTASRR